MVLDDQSIIDLPKHANIGRFKPAIKLRPCGLALNYIVCALCELGCIELVLIILLYQLLKSTGVASGGQKLEARTKFG